MIYVKLDDNVLIFIIADPLSKQVVTNRVEIVSMCVPVLRRGFVSAVKVLCSVSKALIVKVGIYVLKERSMN